MMRDGVSIYLSKSAILIESVFFPAVTTGV